MNSIEMWEAIRRLEYENHPGTITDYILEIALVMHVKLVQIA